MGADNTIAFHSPRLIHGVFRSFVCITARYGLVEVDEVDNMALTLLCWKEEDNKTADDLLSRLRWPNGLAKLVTFGVGMKLDAAAQHTWCYSVDYQEDKAIFEGQSMTWECWQK